MPLVRFYPGDLVHAGLLQDVTRMLNPAAHEVGLVSAWFK